ncbi:hypothetical protein MmiEs2_08100 [Methanimicrococcus stummii]|uniref:Pantoate kinase n=1 Tax=Methanimicrococcus stummii TaxID=3028294 RepID=A0AA96V8A5_9EURY|nr:pantothenate kinase [Methanimicrococcus sp. Es2]WNY28614.1 hypothetical protein MmiEs2_08100 [Methanimicrococcus sp. Es2]
MAFETRTAFSPGHITGFFQIYNHPGLSQKGSIGGGIVLNKGIYTTVTPFEGEGETVVYLNGEKKAAALSSELQIKDLSDFSIAPPNVILAVISELSFSYEQKYGSSFHFKIEERSALPVGSGFGLSAAGALGTAYALNSALNLGLSNKVLAETAHRAEVLTGSGLGDAAGEFAGGLAVREKPGLLYGKSYSLPLSKAELQKTIYCLPLGELSTKSVISDESLTQKINQFGHNALCGFLNEPNLKNFMKESLYFTKNVGLMSPDAESIIDQINESCGMAAQAMLGNTVFAISSDEDNADERLLDLMQEFGDVYECKIETNGPHVCLSAF